jgi:hypothetical protein
MRVFNQYLNSKGPVRSTFHISPLYLFIFFFISTLDSKESMGSVEVTQLTIYHLH